MPTNENTPNLSDAEVQRRLERIEADARQHGEYEQSRTREQLDRLLHYGHVIPISRGFTAQYVRENYPGWTWNQLLDVLQSAGVLVIRPGATPCCAAGVARVEFDSPTAWRVHWDDGHVTQGSVPPGFSTRPEPRGRATALFSLGTARILEVDDDGTPLTD